jgi:hypothetical protein
MAASVFTFETQQGTALTGCKLGAKCKTALRFVSSHVPVKNAPEFGITTGACGQPSGLWIA